MYLLKFLFYFAYLSTVCNKRSAKAANGRVFDIRDSTAVCILLAQQRCS